MNSNSALQKPNVVVIGNFDGVHLGHQSLINFALSEARALAGAVVVVTFWPHPRVALGAGPSLAPLATPRERENLLRALGVAEVCEINFTPDMAALSAERFIRAHLEPLAMGVLVIGHDFRMGANRSGDASMLAALGQAMGFDVLRANPFRIGAEPVSSTRIRNCLVRGDVAGAAALLGRPYVICGHVAHGQGRGAGLGFPTANLEGVETLLPGNGVYATRAIVAGEEGRPLPAVTNIGRNPTFGGDATSVETFILEGEPDLYGERLCLEFVEFLRHERKFASAAELVARIAADVQKAKAILA